MVGALPLILLCTFLCNILGEVLGLARCRHLAGMTMN